MAEPTSIARLMSPALALTLIALGVVSYAVAWWWGRRTLSPPPPPGEELALSQPPLVEESDNHAARSTQHSALHYERDVLAIGGIIAAIIGFFWQPFFRNNVWLPLGGGDFTSFYYPLYSFASRSLHSGIFPLWNPSLYAGMPYAADIQTAALYPPTLLTLWLGNFSYGRLELLVIFHYMLAGALMYAFLRHGFGLHRAACVLGGLAFACCGFMTAHFGHVPMIPVASWLPLAMLGAKKATEGDSLRWGAITGLALALSLLAGHAQIFFYVALTVALWWLWLMFRSYSPLRVGEGRVGVTSELARLLLPPVAALGVFAFIAAPQLLLSNELSGQSVRAGISYDQAATDFTSTPIGLLWLVLPHVWGSNPQSYWSLGNWASTETWAYGGVITLILAALAFVGPTSSPYPPLPREGDAFPPSSTQHPAPSTQHPARWFFALLALVSLLLTLGGADILFGWLFTAVPEWDKFRAAGRLLLPFGFASATLAAFGAARLFAPTPTLPRTAGEGVALTPPLAGEREIVWRRVVYVLLGMVAVIGGIALPIMLARVTEGTNIERSVPFVNDLLMLCFWLAAMAGLVWYARGNATADSLPRRAGEGRGGGLLVALLLVVFILDLFSVNSMFNPTTQDNTKGFQHPEAVKFLQADTERFRIDSDTGIGDIWQPSLAELYGLEDASGIYNPLKPARYDQLFLKARLDRNSNAYSALNIKYVVGLTNTQTLVGQGRIEDMQLKPVFSETHGVTIYRNLNAMARAYIVHRSVVIADGDKQFAYVTGPAFNPRKAVLLESGDTISGTLASSSRYAETSGANPDTGEAATITAYDPNSVTISATVKQDGYLVLSDVDYPGWSATVDGQTTPIIRANYTFRAVRVGPGQHIITMSFTPRLWWAGLVGMLLGLIVAALLLIFGGRVRLRQADGV